MNKKLLVCSAMLLLSSCASYDEEILNFGKPYNFGLEAGSKPELLAVLALTNGGGKSPDEGGTPIICNGFKDDEFIQMAMLARIFVYFLLGRDRARRRFFLRSLWQVLRQGPSLQTLVVALSFMTLHKHFHEYVGRVHGNAETAGHQSPFRETSESASGAAAAAATCREKRAAVSSVPARQEAIA